MTVELDATVAATATAATTDALAATEAPAVYATATSPGRGTDSPRAPAIGPGVRLAHFEIVRPLGAGGMGEVYLATDLALDRPVAIKVLPAAVARDRGRRDRMVREARAQARLNHPNVAHIYFIGEDHGHLFFAMEYIDGETVGQRLERGPLPAEEALEIARMAALGLREAHRHGFTHRDVKPSNLMIDRHGLVKVMDFGLVTDAPVIDGGDDAGALDVAASALVGTPLYMAPEQGQGRAVDHRADIYALGATLHHMIAGAPPYAGGSAAELLSKHETGARAPLASGRGRRTAGLADRLIARMMSLRASDRPASYDLLLAELDAANPARSRPAGFVVRAAAAFVDLLMIALMGAPLAILLDGNGNLVMPIAFYLVLPILIARLGSTLGQALFDLAVVTVRGDRVRFGRAVARFAVQTGLLSIGVAVDAIGDWMGDRTIGSIGEILVFLGFGLPVGELARAALTTADARPLWDRIAGTRVTYRTRGERAIGGLGALAPDASGRRTLP